MIDVLVMGAGPAGALAAILLARRGRRVLVLERQSFPRFSIGESLLASTTQILQDAGLLEKVVSAGFQYKNGATFVRGDDVAHVNFADKSCAGPPFTFQVQRAQFDHLLAKEAERAGAEVRYQVEIVSFAVDEEGPVVGARSAAGVELIRPRFVLDASGFGRVLARLLDLEKPTPAPSRSAVFCHIRDGIPAGAFDRQKIRIGVRAGVWSWLIPFSDGTSSLGAVALHRPDGGEPDDRLRAMVADDAPLAALLGTLQPTRPVAEIAGYAAAVTTLHGPGWALLGNAAEFLDPVFSSGVTIALTSARMAADCVHRQLAGAEVDWEKDFAVPLTYGVETFRSFVDAWYDESLHDILFFRDKDPQVTGYICSVLAGYAWDRENPYTGPLSARRLHTLAALCRNA